MRQNSVVRACRWCGRTDTIMDVVTGKLVNHKHPTSGRRCWGSNKVVDKRPLVPAPESHNHGPGNPVVAVVREDPPPRPAPPVVDRSESVHAARAGLPTLGRRR